MKETQEQFVTNELKQNGFISRNYCLNLWDLNVRPNITRLGAIIHALNASGWEVEGKWEHNKTGKDFVYRVAKAPFKVATYKVLDSAGNVDREITRLQKE